MNRDTRPEEQPGAWLGRALALYREGQHDAADRMVGEGLEQFPNDGGLWQLRGLLRQRRGDLDGALAAMMTASLLVPLQPASRCVLAECYARSRRSELALDLYRHLARDPDCSVDLLPRVAAGLGSLGADEDALGVCKTLINRVPDHHGAYFGAAFYLRRLGHDAEVLQAYLARAQALAPQVLLYRVSLASLLIEGGKLDEAYELLRELDPRAIHCSCCLGRMMSVFLSVGDMRQYQACCDRSDELSGESPAEDLESSWGE